MLHIAMWIMLSAKEALMPICALAKWQEMSRRDYFLDTSFLIRLSEVSVMPR